MGSVVPFTSATRFTDAEVAILVDLIENKLDCMEVTDREDAAELATLQGALVKLKGCQGKFVPVPALRTTRSSLRL